MEPNNQNYNTDELDSPEWVNDEFFIKVLHNMETNAKELQLKNTQISPATLKGEHYASIMFRVVVEYKCDGQDKVKKIIMKTMPEVEGHKKEMFSESKIFETEIKMYTEVIPRFEQILRDIGDDTILRAPILFYELSPRKIIIFEDIVPLGYAVLRDRYLNSDEIKVAYSKLAKWHAISYKINLEEPQYLESFDQGLMAMPNFEDGSVIKEGLKHFIEQLSVTPVLQKYVPHFKSIQSKVINGAVAAFKEYKESRKENSYYVLCHGDFHGKNMMFKHDPHTKKLVDVMLLDYQLCYVGPIVNDLIYSMILLLNADQRANFPEIVHFYFTQFTETLQKIGFDGPMPKLVEFYEQQRQQKYWEIFLLTTFLPAWIFLRGGEIDAEDIMTNKDVQKQMYASKEFIDELEILLPKYLNLGYFDED